jgi:hypothetical protein
MEKRVISGKGTYTFVFFVVKKRKNVAFRRRRESTETATVPRIPDLRFTASGMTDSGITLF